MGRTMRAARFEKATQKVTVEEIPIPEAGEGQFQVRIAAASLCHSDLMNSQRPDSLRGPVTMGHEAVGFISAIHPSVEKKGFKVGDRIGLFYVIDNCFDCEGCDLNGSFCVRPTNGSGKIQGLQADGYFANYAVIDARNALHLPESLPMERMSPLFCAGITAYHSVAKCGLEAGQFLAIIGCGGLGQLAVRYAKAMNLKVVALDIDDRMLRRAKECGADAAFNVKSNPSFSKELRKLTGRRGCHAAAVFSDSPAAYKTAQRALTFGGVLMVVGLSEKPIELPSVMLSFGALQVKGASIGTVAEAQKAVDFTAKHQIIPDVAFRSLDEMPQIYEDFKQGNAEKRIVVRFMDSKSKL